MAGRPTKYTPERVKRILDALSAGNTRRASAAYGGVDEDTVLVWLKRYSEFSEQVKDAEAKAEVAHVANIASAARAGNWTASAWWLERRRPDDWGRRDRLDIVMAVKQMAEEMGLTPEEAAMAVAEAERHLKNMQRATHT